ncbi:MAG: hypothetical protein LLG00_08055 [Planctomycetaceae bacterium]|nr:hypothetical protein [Planctomycetaceae bacterium]
MWTSNRRLSALVAAGYVLALVTAALVHNHSGGDDGCCGVVSSEHREAGDCGPRDCHHKHGEHRSCPGSSERHRCQDSKCAACQFLAEKPSLTTIVSAAWSAALVQTVVSSAPTRPSIDVFTAWQSRAPPLFA